ncbi:MAG: hypothetical protein OCD02_09305 [Spirochaetaceae bacterium]
MNKKNWILIFIPILIMTTIASLFSLLTMDFYFRDSTIIAVKSHYLDLINICIVVPLGIVMFILGMKNHYWAKLFIMGIMAYLAFMFGFNSLSLFFNELFLIYVSLFSLNIFGIILGYEDVKQSGNYLENTIKMRISGIFLVFFAITAYSAWLIEVISSTIYGLIPESIGGMNLPVSVVHVFDMAFALPIIVFGAVLLFKGKISGLIISSIMVVFVFLVCISVFGMELALQYQHMPIDEGKLYSMYLLIPLCIFPLINLLKATSKRF